MKIKGDIIREARRHKEFSQEYMAHLLDISQPQYSRLENGEADFDVSKLSIIIDALDLNPMEVIEFTEKQQVFINSHNTHNIGIVGNRFGDIKSPLVSNDKEVIRQIIREELGNK